MITTLRVRIKDRERQKYFGAYLGGKLIGLGVVVLAMWGITWYLSTKAGATMLGQTTPTVTAKDTVSPINTTWVLVTAFLVFFMQAGFMFLEAGFA